MNTSEQTALWSSLILGANDSIDLLTTYFDDTSFPACFHDITPLVDSRLDLRCVITAPPEGNKNPNAIDELKSYGWNVRTFDGYATFNALIVDKSEVILTNFILSGSGEVIYIHVKDEAQVSMISKHFNNLWHQSKSSLIYEDLLISSVPETQRLIYTASKERWDDIIKSLSQRPELLYALNPRKFEELIAELLLRDGMEVELTARTRDGGRDILARTETNYGSHLYLVECKRFAKNNRVSVDIVRALYGVVESERATGGLIVTTSDFTKDSLKYRENIKYRMDLKDYHRLVEWLRTKT